MGVKVDCVGMSQALETTLSWIREGKKRYIVTPNPEFVMLAQDDSEFKQILNQADLAIPDGTYLKLSGKIKEVVTGVDFMEKLCQQCAKQGFAVALLGGRDGVAKQAAECLQKKYPELIVSFAEDGPEIQSEPAGPDQTGIPAPTDILFVAFGMGKQERWIHHNLSDIPATVAVGVGGSFDYISGRVPRAPLFLRQLGAEWLFRLIIQPWRLRRQLKLIKFFYLILTKPDSV